MKGAFWRLVYAAILLGGVAAYANYNANPTGNTPFGSIVISGVHYATQLICDPVFGTSNCAAVKAGNSAAATDVAIVVSDPTLQAIAALPPALGTSGGWTPKLLNGLTNSAVTVKGSAGQLGLIHCANPNASMTYIQVYDISGAVTVGTSTPVQSYGVPTTNSSGFTLSLVGLQFANAIKVAATTTATGGSAPASAMDCNAGYN